ncbi:MAG: hypothetical protein OEY14_18420, partial [Myxococcales bacterium]|nr:hypothetical protein [Myxococcales bacterium]
SQVGDGTTELRSSPTALPDLSGVATLALGGMHSCAVGSSGAVHCWGRKNEGQTGQLSALPTTPVPTLVAGLPAIESLAAGASNTCALSESGDVLCWGHYQLMLEPPWPIPAYTSVPTAVSGL